MTYGMKGGDANRQKPKKSIKHKEWHTDNTPYGMGDNYGTGVKQKMGRMRDSSMGIMSATPKKLKNPPKSLA